MVSSLSKIGGGALILIFLVVIGIAYYALIGFAIYFAIKYAIRIVLNLTDMGNEKGWWR